MAQQLTSVTILSRDEQTLAMANYRLYGISKALSRDFEYLLPQKPFMK